MKHTDQKQSDIKVTCKAYITPERKAIHLASLRWVLHQTRGIHVANTNMLVISASQLNASDNQPNASPNVDFML